MAITDKNSVIVELYDNPLTERKDDRIGRVVTNKSYDEDDLIAEVAARRSDISPSTMKATIALLSQIAMEKIANGASVSLGLGYYSLGVNGTFIGDNAKWDNALHALSVRVTPNAALREAVRACTVDVRGMAVAGVVINTVTDIVSGEVNSRLTPGGAVNLTGTKIKVDGDNPAVGLTLTNQETNEVTTIAKNLLAVNDPSRITFVIPATLAKGDYKLGIATQYAPSGVSLKEPRMYLFEYILNVL
jgi:hypothetical protein